MGLTAIDTGVMLGFLDRTDPFHEAATAALGKAILEGPTMLPTMAYGESQVMALRAGMNNDWFDKLLDRLGIRCNDLSRNSVTLAACMRAEALRDRRRKQWRMPDAVVVADAIDGGADVIYTTESKWPVTSDIEVRVLDPS